MEPIKVCMLGEFSLTRGQQKIHESGNRSRRVWALLSYLICHRAYPISQNRLIEQLWGSAGEITNPENTLRLLLHRARALLNQLYEGAGQECLLRKEGSYCWNPQIPIIVDCEEFERLCQTGRQNADLPSLLEALSLYGGEFLYRQSSEGWVIPIATHFQNLYLLASQEAAGLLLQQRRYEEAVLICRRCLDIEPYCEPACQQLMQILAAMGRSQEAAQVYEALSRRLFDDFGIHPSEETRSIYRSTAYSPGDRSLPMDEVMEALQETEPLPGALQCDYDYFKVLCFAHRRSLERTGGVAHIALLSVASGTEIPLSRRTQSRILSQLGTVLRTNLRRGDVISQCTASQYILMLPGANYENSCMVCRRCLAAFHRAHPHVSAKIHYLVQPLTPSFHMP